MISITRQIYSTMLSAAILLLVVLLDVSPVKAQVVFADNLCTVVTIINNTNCQATLNFDILPIGSWTNLQVPAQIAQRVDLPSDFIEIHGIYSFNGVLCHFGSPQAAHSGCGMHDWWIDNVRLGLDDDCCCDICMDPCNCTITLNPAAAGTPCR